MYLPFDNFENSKRALISKLRGKCYSVQNVIWSYAVLKFMGTVDVVFVLISDKLILQ